MVRFHALLSTFNRNLRHYMKGFGGANADLDLARYCILDVFREYYPKRLSQAGRFKRVCPSRARERAGLRPRVFGL